jgi:group I intron endonuclease
VYNQICGIYKIQNLVNGKVYFGQSNNIKQRWNSHKNIAKNKYSKSYNYHLYRSIRKYGIENFEFSIVKECKEDDLNCLEQFYIISYSSWNSNYGYNKSIGGEGGGSKTEEAKKNMRKPKSELAKLHIRLSHLGIRHTTEQKEKISNSCKEYFRNNPRTEENRKKSSITSIKIWDKIGRKPVKIITKPKTSKQLEAVHKQRKDIKCVETGIIYHGLNEAKRTTKISCIERALSNGTSAGGFHWEYVNTVRKPRPKYKIRNVETNEIFESLNAIVRCYGGDSRVYKKHIGSKASYKGFHWEICLIYKYCNN